MLFGYFQQGIYKFGLIVGRLSTKLQLEYFSLMKVLIQKSVNVVGICSAAARCMLRECFACGYSFFLTCVIFPHFVHVIVDSHQKILYSKIF